MSLGRVHSETAYKALKGAFRRLTKLAGGEEAAAAITRVDRQRIGRYGRPQEAMMPPVDVVADLEADTGEPLVCRVLADLAGFLLIPKPPVSGGPAWVRHLGALGKEAGEAIARLAEAFGNDGRITADEIQSLRLRDEVREAMEVLARIDKALEAVEQGGEGDR